MQGYIHSKESFGTVDGPGVRYVLFLQGCPMRCKYCHNPDTWSANSGTLVSPEEIIEEYLNNRSFYSNGGITVSGGEPLLQIDFLIELFSLAKNHDIHTCIDTSGITFNADDEKHLKKLNALLSLCDLIMLDIKHIDPKRHKELTGHDNANILAFAEHLSELGIPICIRHVLVPGITDDKNDLEKLGEFIGRLKSLKALDLLPYHTLHLHKYENLGIPYPLIGIPDASKDDVISAKKHILNGIRNTRK